MAARRSRAAEGDAGDRRPQHRVARPACCTVYGRVPPGTERSGFANTTLDTILRNLGVNTCVMAGVTTCVCVSTTIREGVEYNYRMIVVSDAVAEIHRDTHEAELNTMARIFADVKSSDEVIKMLAQG